MPCTKCSNGKWKIGIGKCQYDTKAKCLKAQAAIHARARDKDKSLPRHVEALINKTRCEDCE